MKDRKITIGRLIITLLMLTIVIVGGTYAWFSYASKKAAIVLSIGDLNDSKVIIKPYQIKETMVPVNTYTSGVYSQVKAINNSSNKIILTLYYKINELDDVLINNGLKYTIVSSNTLDGEYTEVETGDFTTVQNNKQVIFDTKIAPNTTIYYRVYLWLDSSVGNQVVLQNTSLNLELNGNVQQEANVPILDSGMIPVVISNDGTVTTISANNDDWYNYPKQEWANIVLVTSESRSNYLNTEGVEVLSSDILGYYVWIPRYRYKIWTTGVSSTGEEQSINIMFEPQNSPMMLGTTIGSYRTHPAFWWDSNNDGVVSNDELLPGIWVGKFETTGDETTPTVLPDVQSLRNQNVSTQFTTSLKFSGGTLTDGIVTYTGNDTYGLTNSTNSHMMKNSEWGAVAYLSHSIYGANREIYINNSSSYYTGRSGGNVGGSTAINTVYTDQTSTTQYNTYGFYTWDGYLLDYGTNTKGTTHNINKVASTTGNITGIYDMSGGAFEYVMGVLADSNGNPLSGYSTSKNSGFNGIIYDGGDNTEYTSGISFPTSNYYDLYTSTSSTTACNGGICYGHALSETASWYSDYASFISSDGPWFRRGGFYFGASAGTFLSYYSYGGGDNFYSWRSVLIPQYTVTYDANGGEISTISYTTSGAHTYNVPSSGTYKLEVWGAQGGNGSSAGLNYGGYSTGQIYLKNSEVLYINVGGEGQEAKSGSGNISYGGYNGGGNGGTGTQGGAGGGGASHIATVSGLLSSLSPSTDIDKILIVAGGGGGSYGETVKKGAGGGYLGLNGGYSSNYTSYYATGGSQSAGGKDNAEGNNYAKFGQGGSYFTSQGGNGGGGGYYGGGGSSRNHSGGGGGSGYIGNDLLTDKYMYCYNCTTSNDVGTKTYTTTNVSDTPTSDYAKSGDGAAIITQLSGVKFINYGSKYGTLPTPTRIGYVFVGWNTASDGSGEYITSSTNVSINYSHTLYAIWIPPTTVTFDANGGTLLIGNYNEPGEYEFTVPCDWNYQMEVWGAEGATSGGAGGYGGYSRGSTFLSQNAVLYINVGGQGTVMSGGYNGGGAGSASYSNGSAYKNGGGGGGATHIATVSGLLSSLSSNQGSILIVAGGGGGGSYISGNYSGGSGGGFSGVSGTGRSVTPNPGTQTDGYSFGQAQAALAGGSYSWGESGRGGGGGGYYGGYASQTTVNGIAGGGGGSGYIGNSRLTNKAMYCYNCTTSDVVGTKTYTTTNVSDTPIIEYAKSGNGAARITLVNEKDVYYNSPYGLLPVPVSEGFTFLGWYTEETGGVKVANDTVVSVRENHTLYAHWQEINKYWITYDANEGTDAPDAQMKYENGVLKISDIKPVRAGYLFLGWSTSKDATEPTYNPGDEYSANADITLYAVWAFIYPPIFTYTGTYQIVDDNDNEITDISSYLGNWKIRFLTSGTLRFTDLKGVASGIDIFVVAGGGAGASGSSFTMTSRGGGGGGGGASITVKQFPVEINTDYQIVVGGAKANSTFGKGSTAYYTALAGSNPSSAPYYTDGGGWTVPVGAGGAGRLSGQTGNYGALDVIVNKGASGNGSAGTYEFNGTSGKRYGAGGGKGGTGVSTNVGGSGGSGGTGGADGGGSGGKGCSYKTSSGISGGYSGSAATANTGSGGGGGGGQCGSGSSSSGSKGSGGSGASGIVIIRNTR